MRVIEMICISTSFIHPSIHPILEVNTQKDMAMHNLQVIKDGFQVEVTY